ncbi:PREDICTED: natural killer cell receptor 2B4, partial [Leptosomus discolor]|uniref:natural killer cell receptor 2B4 n=1 Tax=Leptosomus discolor TaxID=188344 RepID=UPI0005223A84
LLSVGVSSLRPRVGALDIRAHAEKRRQAQKLKNKGSSGQHSCRSPGLPECREQAVSADGALQLQSEKPPQLWTEVGWTVRLDTGQQWRILTAQKDAAAEYRKGPFSWRTDFQEDPVSLRISPVSPADSGVYSVEFQDGSGAITAVCFRVSVWEPVRPPQLQTDILHWEQDRCNLSLVCTVPGATNVSYSWSCTGKAVGHQPWLHLQVLGDTNSTVCCCNASNPVSWSTASTDAAAACRAAAPGLSSLVPWWAVAMFLGLALAISVAIVIAWYWRKTRGKEPPGALPVWGLTVYEEVGKARTGREPNGTGEATVTGNTVYAVICPKKQLPSGARNLHHLLHRSAQGEGSCSAPQSPSLKRKRLDPALVFTAYAE